MKSFLSKRCFVLLLLLQAVNSYAVASDPVQYCASGRQEGIIGTTDAVTVDNPADNIFHVMIDAPLTGKEQVWLVYELSGVADHTAVARSINDQLSAGGYVVKQQKGWHQQRERIASAWLHQGDNVIRFTLPQGAAYSYRIRHLSIEIEPTDCQQATVALEVNKSSALHYYQGQAYVKGFAWGRNQKAVSVTLDGEPAKVLDGAFEGMVTLGQDPIEVEATYADGQVLCERVALDKAQLADQYYPLQANSYRAEKLFSTQTDYQISLAGASLQMKAGALNQPANISITSLRAIDIPALDAGMINVTGHHAGYRFLPHKTLFEQEVSLRLAYDETKVPDGYTAQDIKTYFFDEATHHWIALPTDTILEARAEVVSRTTHFTDMINAIIQVPESPEVNAYNSTSMKGIKAANPTAAIGLINAPQANNTGSAALNYPIKLPSGRAGMQPQLSISYNSGGGNGWLGLGWNLNIPAITIDTRWGVPRYDEKLETETYSLNGEQLSPVAHRGTPVGRIANKQFYPRVEGSFNKIIRHGSKPSDYYWQVTDKNGVQYFYGGRTNLDTDAVLRDATGNIAHWALTEVRDLNGNFVRYHYEKAEDTSTQDGIKDAQLYVSKITYTGHGTAEGPYTVLFDQRADKRKDVSINARYGFKQVTDALLEKITVQYGSELVRSYKLWYHEGPFYKTLLDSISEYDSQGQRFNAHAFEYYDDINGENSYTPFVDKPVNWQVPDDDIQHKLVTGAIFSDAASVLSGTKSNNFSAGLAITVGLGPNVSTKQNSAGGSYNYGQSSSEGMASLIDINGDGLPDKVFIKDEVMYYRANQMGADGKTSFGERYAIQGANTFFKEKSRTHSGGAEAHVGIGVGSVMAGYNRGKTKSTTSAYFTEVNGDQLPDIVINGKVLFNRIDPNSGHPTFVEASDATSSPVNTSGEIAADLLINDDLEQGEDAKRYPLHDVVRMWQAPYDGRIKIDAPVRLLLPAADKAAPGADGVRVAIQLRDREEWSATIPAGDGNPRIPSRVSNLSVKKGDRVYFRVQSVYNGLQDSVEWAPVIEYRNQDATQTDANGQPLYKFDSQKDFVLTADQTVDAPMKGSVQIEGRFTKAMTSDDVQVLVIKEKGGQEEVVLEKNYAWNQTADEDLRKLVAVDSAESLSFKVMASTNVDWAALQWQPHVYYENAADAHTKVKNEKGEPLVEFYPVPGLSIYAEIAQQGKVFVVSQDVQRVNIIPQLIANGQSSASQLVFSVKKRSQLLAKDTIYLSSGRITSADALDIAVKKGDTLYIEYHMADPKAMTLLKEISSKISISNREENVQPYVYIQRGNTEFGPMYRQWGQFAYNGNEERATKAIEQAALKMSDNFTKFDELDKNKIKDDGRALKSEKAFNPADEIFIPMVPFGKQHIWNGYDDLTYLNATVISSSRYGEDDLVPPGSPQATINTKSRAINKVSVSINDSYTLGGSLAIGVGGSYGKTDGYTEVRSDFMDMNGDRYPDIVTPNGIQYTHAQGGLSGRVTYHSLLNHRTTMHSTGSSLSGSYVLSSAQPAATNTKRFSVSVGDGKSSAGLSGNFGNGDNSTDFTYMDINGDGLPDRIYQGGEVALNLGYRFAKKENWGFSDIQAGTSKSKGAGLGVSIVGGSISAGVGLSLSENNVTHSLQDVNGDGLVDMYYLTEQGVEVRLNYGNGFAEAIAWNGAEAISENSSTSESANIAFTAGVTLFGVKLCVNPSTSIGRGMSRESVRLSDMDGDGYPDFVRSSNDAMLKVKSSTIGKTNMLKAVHRPLGASFVVDYKREGNTYDLPNNLWTLESVKLYDGHTGDGVDTLLTTFAYEAGYHDRHERDFYGFAKVTTHTRDASSKTIYNSLVQTFSNNNYYSKGLLLTETVTDSKSRKYSEKENIFTLTDLSTGKPLSKALLEDKAFAGRVFPALTESYQRFFEGKAEAGKTTHMRLSYDGYGNVKKIEDLGDVDTDSDDLLAEVTYHYYSTEPYIVNKPKRIAVSGQGNTYRVREADIDAIGQVTAIRQYLDEQQAAMHSLAYDKYGNLTELTRPANEKGERLKISYQYDEQIHSYPVKVSNSYGYSSQAVYEYSFGQMLSSTDLNGQVVSYQIDDLGRVISITGPYEQKAGKYTLAFDYHPEAATPWALTKHYDPAHPGNALETAIFVDGLGRVLQTKKDAAIFQGENKADKEQMVVSGKVVYDAYGRAIEAYQPMMEDTGNAGKFNAGQGEYPTATVYDVLGRAVSMTLPDGAVTETSYDFGHDREGSKQFVTQTIDANKILTEQFTDTRGRVTAVRNAGSVWTSFVYNAVGEQLTATDDLGHSTVSAYDLLGRRVSRKHSDAGLTQYSYDLAGNLTSLTTANLQEGSGPVVYQYEYERLTSILYPDNSENDVHYSYGAAGAEHNRAGRIVTQEDASGVQEFLYGPLGEVVKNIRTIVIPQHDDQTYTTEWSYDTWNRLTEMTYADGETVTYHYNTGGLLQSMSGKKQADKYDYVTQLGYDKFEQRVLLSYGNGTKTTYSYEPKRRRLSNMTAKTAAGRAMMDNSYGYDAVNNILSLKNNAPVPNSNLMGGSSEYSYEYDDLYRLTSAEGKFTGSNHEHRYSLEMKYNSVGSILEKAQLHERKGSNGDNTWNTQKKTSYSQSYEYADSQPHAPIHIGEQKYSYDKNGNQTGWTHDVSGQRRQIVWDEENRIRAIADNGSVQHYIYDASGTRVLKGKSKGQSIYVNSEYKAGSGSIGNYTVYVNPYLVLRSGGYTKHYYIEGQRIVSKLGSGLDNNGKGQLKAGQDKVNYGKKQADIREGIVKNLKWLGIDGAVLTAGNSGKTPPGQLKGGKGGNAGGGSGNTGKDKASEKFQYFYHPDHLGSSSYITDASGEVYQHLEYFAFGETFVEEHSNTHRTPYLFNGKELDDETGLYYYGARYYDARTSVWLAVDPLAEKYAGLSPYVYCANNPILFIDPDGKDVIIALGGIDYKGSGDTGSAGKMINDLNKWANDNGIKDFSAQAFASDFGDNVKADVIKYIRENYEIGSGEKLIIYGYSWGGDTGVEITETLKELGIEVDLLITVDAAKGPASGDLGDWVDREIPDNVKEATNYYQNNPSKIRSHGDEAKAKDSKKTNIMNIQVTDSDISHSNIDERVQPIVTEEIKSKVKE